MKIILLLFPLLLGLVPCAGAAGTSRIELNDGSVIIGEIVSLANGVYTVKAESMGQITIDMSRIRSIETTPPAVAPPQQNLPQQPQPEDYSDPLTAMRQKLEEKMKSDPKVVEGIAALKEDPDFQELLSDPGIVEALKTQDVNALMSNPKFLKILNSPVIREIAERVQGKDGN